MPEPALHVCLLGQFQTAVGGVVLTSDVWRRKKASDVVKLLALQPQGRMQREQVLEALWPELDEKSGMNNLHQNLHHARRLLEPNLAKGAKPTLFGVRARHFGCCVWMRGSRWTTTSSNAC